MKVEAVEIKKIGINGEGIGYIDRKIIFIPGALIDEVVDVEIIRQTRKFYEGKIIRIVTPSKDRREPNCPIERECQGCSLLHMKYGSQLKYKKESIRESIRKYTNYDLQYTIFKDVIGSKEMDGFITNVNLPVVSYKGKISFGIYQRESKYLTVLTRCMKQHPMINACLQGLETIVTNHKCKAYNDKTRLGLRFLKLKKVGQALQIVLITGKDGLAPEVIEEISKLPNVEGIFLSTNTSRYQEFEELGYSKVFGSTRLPWYIHDQKYLVSVKSKIPEHLDMYLKRNTEILKLLENSQKIVSLHCGIGVLELQSNKEIIAIDEKNYHIEDAKMNQKWLKKENVKFVKGDIDDKIVIYAKQKAYDTFVIQNGRFGLSDTIKDSIRLSKVKHVIYSCDSHSTLAKDLADLERYYTLDKIVAIDSFTFTPYVTTIVKLTRK